MGPAVLFWRVRFPEFEKLSLAWLFVGRGIVACVGIVVTFNNVKSP